MKSIYIRLIILLSFEILYVSRVLYLDILSVIVLLLALILDLRKVSNFKSDLSSLVYYSFWAIISLTIFIQNKIYISSIFSPIVIAIILKIILILITFLRFKHISVTKSILSKIWLITFFVYCSELILNSTHITSNLFLIVTVLSGLETMGIILTFPTWVNYTPSVFNKN